MGIARFGLVLLAAAAAVSLLVGPAGAGPRHRPVLAPGVHRLTVDVQGTERSYRVYVPAHVRTGKPLPVVLNFHGAGTDGAIQELYSRMDVLAERKGFIVAYPDGTGSFVFLTWNAGTCCGVASRRHVDDVGFSLALLDDLARRTPVDHRRVFATGISNGGMMAYRLAAEADGRIAAAAPVAGTLTGPFRPRRAVSLMAFNSVDDPQVRYGGSVEGGVVFPGVAETLKRWAGFDGCRPRPVVERRISAAQKSPDAGQTATRIVYPGCRGGAEVVQWKLTGAGHVWPGGLRVGLAGLIGRPTSIVDASEAMWAFFSRHPLPQRRS